MQVISYRLEKFQPYDDIARFRQDFFESKVNIRYINDYKENDLEYFLRIPFRNSGNLNINKLVIKEFVVQSIYELSSTDAYVSTYIEKFETKDISKLFVSGATNHLRFTFEVENDQILEDDLEVIAIKICLEPYVPELLDCQQDIVIFARDIGEGKYMVEYSNTSVEEK